MFEESARLASIKIKLLTDTAQIPKQATSGSSGYDLYADEDLIIAPGRRKLVSTGVALQLPPGTEGQVRSRSGLANKHGVFVLNSPGTIDSDYIGEIKVILQNLGTMQFRIDVGDRIAQLVFARVEHMPFDAVTELVATERNAGGFGHSGR